MPHAGHQNPSARQNAATLPRAISAPISPGDFNSQQGHQIGGRQPLMATPPLALTCQRCISLRSSSSPRFDLDTAASAPKYITHWRLRQRWPNTSSKAEKLGAGFYHIDAFAGSRRLSTKNALDFYLGNARRAMRHGFSRGGGFIQQRSVGHAPGRSGRSPFAGSSAALPDGPGRFQPDTECKRYTSRGFQTHCAESLSAVITVS